MRDSKYYIIEEFLSNGNMIIRYLHLNMLDPVPIPKGHLKKIVQGDKRNIKDEQNEQWLNRKRKWNMITNTDIKTDVTLTDACDMDLMEGIDDTVNATNADVNTNANTENNMNITSLNTSKEHMKG